MKKTFTYQGQIYEYEQVVSRGRSIRILINQQGMIELRVGRGCSIAQAEQFLNQHQAWAVKYLKKRREELADYIHTFAEGDVFFFRGEEYRLTIRDSKAASRNQTSNDRQWQSEKANNSQPKIEATKVNQPKLEKTKASLPKFDQSKTIYVEKIPGKMIVKGEALTQEEIKWALEQWYIKNARIRFQSRCEYFAPIVGVMYRRISIKNQKSRWGSCSNKSNLNFNWRLIMAEDEILDYVVVHELCHLKEMNHSESFWKKVEVVLPDYKEQEQWLNKEGNKRLNW